MSTPVTSLRPPQIEVPAQTETNSLVEAFAKLETTTEALRKLRQLERVAAKQILDSLDKAMPESVERSVLRRNILDTLAFYRRQMSKFLEEQTIESLSEG